MNERPYQDLMESYLTEGIKVDEFVEAWMKQWKADRDASVLHDTRFQRIINRLFTSCDAYSPLPWTTYQTDEARLRQEVLLLHHIWFG